MIKNQKHDFSISNERLQTLINNILDVIVEIDQNGNFTYVSPQSFQLLGYEPEEIIGKNSLDYVHPDDLEIVVNAMRKALLEKHYFSFEYRAKHKNGNYINVSTKGDLINQKVGSKHIFVVRDISQKINDEKKVKESEQQYRKILESIGDPIQVVDEKLQIIMVNTNYYGQYNFYGMDQKIWYYY